MKVIGSKSISKANYSTELNRRLIDMKNEFKLQIKTNIPNYLIPG